jgi:hypothetical protein
MQELADGEATINFMRKKSKRFVFPKAEDVASVDFSDILYSLPKPFSRGGISRVTQGFH